MKKLLPALVLSAALAGGAFPASAVEENTQFTTSIPADALSISLYYNEDVYDSQNNKIGDVNDILLDKGGNVQTAIIGVGGFLGAGRRTSLFRSRP